MKPFVPVVYGAPDDRPDEADAVKNATAIRDALQRLGFRSEIVEVGLDLSALSALAAAKPHAVFNLVESINGDGRLAFLANAALDHYGVVYTGAPTAAYVQSSSKLLTKLVLHSAGLPTPDHWTADAPAGRRVIIKSVWEHASYGLDQDSVVDGADAAAEIARRVARFGGEFFAEAYVAGREFNVAILERAGEPHLLPMAEMSFDALPAGVLPIIDYAAKWRDDEDRYHLMQRRFGVEAGEPALAQRLASIALDCWRAAGLRGYARVDMRVDQAGDVFILEYNANPCLAPDAGFAAAAAEAGLTYDDAIAAIVAAAQETQTQPCFAFAR